MQCLKQERWGMSKELLKALVDVLDDLKLRKNLSEDDALNISDSVLVRAEKAIENYLTQPEQEPVAWCQLVDGKVQDLLTSFEMKDWLYDKSWMPLYLAPPKPESLSDEQIEAAREGNTITVHAFARAIEKLHGITGLDDAI